MLKSYPIFNFKIRPRSISRLINFKFRTKYLCFYSAVISMIHNNPNDDYTVSYNQPKKYHPDDVQEHTHIPSQMLHTYKIKSQRYQPKKNKKPFRFKCHYMLSISLAPNRKPSHWPYLYIFLIIFTWKRYSWIINC